MQATKTGSPQLKVILRGYSARKFRCCSAEISLWDLRQARSQIDVVGPSLLEATRKFRDELIETIPTEGMTTPLWPSEVFSSIPEVIEVVEGWNEKDRPCWHSTVWIMVTEAREGSFSLMVVVHNVRSELRHHGGFSNIARFDKRGTDPSGLFRSMERTLRRWERNSAWRRLYHATHQVAWEK